MAVRKAKPKSSLEGQLVRRTFSGGKSQDVITFEMPGFHSKPTGKPSAGRFGAKSRKQK